jgi:hypothetical protein
MRIHRKSAHHFQCRRGVLAADRGLTCSGTVVGAKACLSWSEGCGFAVLRPLGSSAWIKVLGGARLWGAVPGCF